MTIGTIVGPLIILFILWSLFIAIRYWVLYGNPLENDSGLDLYAFYASFVTLMVFLIIVIVIAALAVDYWNYKLF